MMQTRETGCRWCGNRHDPLALCRARRVSRRTFLFTAAAAAIGAAIVPACNVAPDIAWSQRWSIRWLTDDQHLVAVFLPPIEVAHRA